MGEPDKPTAASDAAARSDPATATFSVFYRAHYRPLVNAARALGAEGTQAEEFVNEIMTRLWKRWAHIEDPLPYAREALRRHLRRTLARDEQRLSLSIRGGHLTDSADQDTCLDDWEGQEWVLQQLRNLPPAQAEVMAHVIDGFTPAEIARQLGKSAAAQRQNLRLARQKLTARLQADASPATTATSEEESQ